MYPTITDLLNDLLGTSWQFPIQSFGFFVALSFLLANYLLAKELKRKEALGLLQPIIEERWEGKPASILEYILNALLGLVLGYKLVHAALNWQAFNAHVQEFVLSTQGNIIGGIAGAALFIYLKYRDSEKHKLATPILKKYKVYPHNRVSDIILLAFIGGLIGAKVFHNLENWQEFIKDPIENLIAFSGLTFYGGLIVAAALILIYAHKKNIGIGHLCDAAAPCLMLGYGVGRMGCHISGDGDWGITNLNPKPFSFLPDWAWAYTYPHNVNSEGIQIPDCWGAHCTQLPLPVWPTPLYECIIGIALFFILYKLGLKNKAPFWLFGIYLMLNGMERFLIEKIRVNTTYTIAGFRPTQAEIISVLLFLLGAFLVYKTHKVKSTTAPATQ
jgi:prolipoprotein diacylglyceryltransferase